jgi:hypothetical protein
MGAKSPHFPNPKLEFIIAGPVPEHGAGSQETF